MNLRLEELRRRLLEPSALPNGNKTVYWRSSLPTVPNLPAGEVVDILATNAGGVEAPAAPESVTDAVLQYVQQAAPVTPAYQDTVEPAGSQYHLAQAVSKVFDQSRSFEESVIGVQQMIEPMKQAGSALSRSLDPLKHLQEQIRELGKAFDSIRSFRDQIATLAVSFEPMKSLEQQVAQFSQAFDVHLQRLSRSLETARSFKTELLNLARQFDAVDDLQNQFQLIAETYRASERADNKSAAAA
jgi:hypothetical protein